MPSSGTEEEHEESDAKEWSTWQSAAFIGALCAIPLLLPLFLLSPIETLVFWATSVLLYLGMIKIWGPGFVVEALLILIILSILFFILPEIFAGA